MNSDPHPPVCDYEGSTYQTEFWEKGGRDYEDRAEAVALKRLLPSRGDLLLELGAGAGRNTTRYEGYQRVVLLDYSTTQLQQARARLGNSPRYIYVAADVYRLPFVDGLFDGATLIRVLHHLADGQAALQQIRQVMRPGGTFILEFANKQNVKAIARYLLRRQPWNPFSPEPIEFVELNYNFHPATTRTWLQQTGFAIQRQLTVSHFRIWMLKRLLPTGLLVSLDSLAQLTGNWWQFSPSVFVRTQAVGNTPVASPGAFFKCPSCGRATLTEEPSRMVCQECQTAWPVQDGIYNFKQPLPL
ncbi:MAG: methyltransferase domain-containing protein [Anaerolineales bacterium]|nr:methyltransferase domain-containing protein [Anaerolineales bacterium]